MMSCKEIQLELSESSGHNKVPITEHMHCNMLVLFKEMFCLFVEYVVCFPYRSCYPQVSSEPIINIMLLCCFTLFIALI